MTTPVMPRRATRDLPAGDRTQRWRDIAGSPKSLPRIFTATTPRCFLRGRKRRGRRRNSELPMQSRSGHRRWRAMCCRWRHRRTSTTRSTALTLLRYYVLANQPDVPARGSRHRQPNGRPSPRGRSLFPRGANVSARFADAGCCRNDRGSGACQVACQPGANRRIDRGVLRCDTALGPWRNSRLVSTNPDGQRAMAEAVRTVLGMAESELSDSEAVARVLDGGQTHTWDIRCSWR